MFCHYQTNAPPVEVSYNKDPLFVGMSNILLELYDISGTISLHA